MSESVAKQPRSLLFRILRFGAIVVACCLALLVAGSAWLWCEAWAAMGEWNDLGGVVSVEGNLIAPKSIHFGAAPAVPTSRDVDAVCNSLERMRRLPGCEDLHLSAFGDFGFDDAAIECMLEAFRPVGFSAYGVDLDDDGLRLLASNGCTTNVYVAYCPITAAGLAALLDQPRIQRVSVGESDLSDEEQDRLTTKYGERIGF